MAHIVGVRFGRSEPVIFVDGQGIDGLGIGTCVVIEDGSQTKLAWIIVTPSQMIYDDLRGPLRSILRKATPEDVAALGNRQGAQLPVGTEQHKDQR